MKARDKFWIFGVRPGQDDGWLHHSSPYSLYGSKMTPAEAAYYLNVPNMIMVNCQGIPVPFSHDAEKYMITFTPCKKVLWSVDGSIGGRLGFEAEYVLDLSRRYPNLCGAFMDDFIGRYRNLPEPERTEKAAAFLKGVREQLDKADKKLELYVVYYTHEIDPSHIELFKPIDGLTNWTWNCQDLHNLEENLTTLRNFMPDKKLLNGIYLFDFPSKQPVPLDLMEYQCNTSLRLMKEGKLDGMIFETNSVMGVGSPNDAWTREWIALHGDEEVPD